MKQLPILFILLTVFNCNSNSKDSISYGAKSSDETTDETTNETAQNHLTGKQLMESNCYVCHSLTASHDNRLAPPMEAIKRHYITEDTSKEAFIQDMQNWIKNPNEKDAKMYGAVKRFGVMPKAYYNDADITQIAAYLYDNDIEKPEWFDEHYKNTKKGGK
jgi:mono/diheme cytochrome c family protein